MPFPYLDETLELNESTRMGMDGSFIALDDGVTHYELGGDERGVPVVLVHGFSVPYFIFDTTFEFLCKSGFHVLRYDLFGRGLSDRPRLNYDIHLFVRQLKNLLDALNLKPVHLIGLSMGGPITASFTAEYPDYVSSHILIDPAGARNISISPMLKVVKLPIVGELLLGLFGSASMVKSIASDFFDPQLVEQFQAKYKIQMEFKGFKRAILSTMRSGMLGSFLDTYKKLGALKKPTLVFWGMNDNTTPFEDHTLVLQALPHAKFHAVENCGHLPHYEKPEFFNPILLEFITR